MKLVLASNNPNKLREFREILEPAGIVLLSQREAGCALDPEETGETFEENAFIKAAAVCRATGLPAVADDSGLEVDALDGAPGVRSARYTGRHDDTDEARRRLLLRNLGGNPHRGARFVCAVCCVFPNGDTLRARGVCDGGIAGEERGGGGFGYDALFIPEGETRTMAELSADEKNAVSHRGRALRGFAEKMREYEHAHK